MNRAAAILLTFLGAILVVAGTAFLTVSSAYIEWILGFVCLLVMCLATAAAHPAWEWPRRLVFAAERAPVGKGLAGRWKGTLRVWPAQPAGTLRVYPVCVVFTEDDRRIRLIGTRGEGDDGVALVELLEYDRTRENVDVRIVVQIGGLQEGRVVGLCRRRNVLVSEDDTEPFSLELRRDRPRRLKRPLQSADQELADVA